MHTGCLAFAIYPVKRTANVTKEGLPRRVEVEVHASRQSW